MRLGLPLLGIIGISVTVTGTQEAPKVKIVKKTEDLEETEYVESPTNVADPLPSAPAVVAPK
jgi:AsmA protein